MEHHGSGHRNNCPDGLLRHSILVVSANTAQSQILSHLSQLVLELGGSEDTIVRMVVDNHNSHECHLSFELLLGMQSFSSSQVDNMGYKHKATSMVHKNLTTFVALVRQVSPSGTEEPFRG